MPTEKDLIEKGWWGSIVGVLLMTGSIAEKDNVRWKALGRWTSDIGSWGCANIFDDELSFALDKPIPLDQRAYGPFVGMSASTARLLKQKCKAIWDEASSKTGSSIVTCGCSL